MESNIWLIALGLGFVALAALLVVVLSRVQALFRIATGVEFESASRRDRRAKRAPRARAAHRACAGAQVEAAQNAQTGRAELAAALNQFTQALQNQLAGSAQSRTSAWRR